MSYHTTYFLSLIPPTPAAAPRRLPPRARPNRNPVRGLTRAAGRDERESRLRLMLRHGIMDEKKQAALDKARTPKGREIAKALRPFARFQSADEYSRLVEGMCEEQVPPVTRAAPVATGVPRTE